MSEMNETIDSLKEQLSDEALNDSLTLGQLKRIVKQFPNKQKADSDSLSNEIDEFYSYAEIAECQENKKIFEEGFGESWTNSTNSERKVYVEYLLETLELKDPGKRFSSAKKLLYIAQGQICEIKFMGDRFSLSMPKHFMDIMHESFIILTMIANSGTFGELKTQEKHLEWVIENNKLLRKCGALLSYAQALKLACCAHDHYSRLDGNLERQAYIDDTNIEIGFYLTLLYMLVEVHRGDESFGAELADLNPPLTVFLFDVVASLREKEKNAKGYPVKKLLLLLWKVILASFGGLNEIRKQREAVREINGLPPIQGKGLMLKSTPTDYQTFLTEVTHKYPTYVPPPCPVIAMSSIPINSFFNNNPNGNESSQQNPSNNGSSAPTPKSRKQQFQTNQRQPFIFPFSESTPSVPKSIEEAGDLYLNFMYVNLGTLQCWKEREELKKSLVNGDINGAGYKGNFFMPDTTKEILSGDYRKQDKVKIKEIEKLERVEILYVSLNLRSIFPHLPNIVIVLLKLLLATVPSNTSNIKGNENDNISKDGTSANNAPNGNTIEEVDIKRHREITSKAVSAILLLMLKHFKLNHVLKFEYLSQLLVDANCLLLIFKILSLQDVSVTIKAKNEMEDLNFFRYCTTINNDNAIEAENSLNNLEHNSSSDTSMQPKDESSKGKQRSHPNNNLNEDSDYCWRNFFAAINFLRVLQKLIKKKTHRTLSLVRCKSSAILKKILKVSHPLLELYALKVLKNQIPFIGRKWKQSNMKVITSIYLNCRPDLRDEWIASADADAEVEDAVATEPILYGFQWQPQEQSLRELTKFYNERNYFSPNNGQLSAFDNRNIPDIFPPHYTKPLNHINSAYMTDDIMLDQSFIENWEQWLQEEVYGFSAIKPQLNVIDEYYNDDLINAFQNGDGSEWDTPLTSYTDEKDPFSLINWNNASPSELSEFEQKMKFNENSVRYKSNFVEQIFDAETHIDPDLKEVDTNYCWPDEMLDRIAPEEVMIYQPTPYQSDDES
ncbi:7249_t:CDS:10 [Acaulospora morrowiae]|uniref:7249_t:CDS:1 n=1 Tax=Acaulospora morrowiae TaxID=94023 RepID=A0A9N9AYV9_9GLOM|nr:7249_t:CDS:10 [Acaulospora morrowiae]